LEARESTTDVLGLIDRRIGLERLSQDLRRAERIVRPTGDTRSPTTTTAARCSAS
jgi:hypothetical protein